MGADGNMMTIPKCYGMTTDDIKAWGGKIGVTNEEAIKGDIDIISGFLASPAMNPESSLWTILSQKFDLYLFEFPDAIYLIMDKAESYHKNTLG
jgi:hypothetical protein